MGSASIAGVGEGQLANKLRRLQIYFSLVICVQRNQILTNKQNKWPNHWQAEKGLQKLYNS